MDRQSEWTLSEAARLLRERQHRLIYLCEKGVVIPDFGEASGRGSSRRFSARNLLEFSIALRLRKLTLPVGVIGAILYTLRKFEASMAEGQPGFNLPFSLRAGSPDLRVVVKDGEKLFFSLANPGASPRLFGGFDFENLVESAGSTAVQEISAAAVRGANLRRFGGVEGSRYARIEFSITQAAHDLNLLEP